MYILANLPFTFIKLKIFDIFSQMSQAAYKNFSKFFISPKHNNKYLHVTGLNFGLRFFFSQTLTNNVLLIMCLFHNCFLNLQTVHATLKSELDSSYTKSEKEVTDHEKITRSSYKVSQNNLRINLLELRSLKIG